MIFKQRRRPSLYLHPIRAKKVRYFTDRRLKDRIVDPPAAVSLPARANDWTGVARPERAPAAPEAQELSDDMANGGIRREPELPEEQDIVPPPPPPPGEFEFDDSAGDDAAAARRATDRMRGAARQTSLDQQDGIKL